MTADAPAPEDRLRAALVAASSAPVPDGWTSIRDRLADPPLTLDLRPPRARHRPARALSVAAGILIVLVGAVALAPRDEADAPVATDQAGATGWYAPTGLPDGWRVTQVTYRSSTRCAQRGQRWVARSGDAAVTVTRSDCSGTSRAAQDDAATVDGSTPVDLGGGITATRTALAGDQLLGWSHDGRWEVLAVQATAEQAAEVGRAAVADPSLAFALPGFTRFDGWDHAAIEAAPDVWVELVAPDGSQVSYSLSLPGTGARQRSLSVPRPVQVPGQDRPVVALDRTDGAWTWDRYAGSWTDADLGGYVVLSPSDPGAMAVEVICDERATIEDRDRAEAALRHLVGALRPATTTGWRAFLATAERADPALSAVEVLADLTTVPAPVEPPGSPPVTFPASGGGPVTCPSS